jgi:hypothetical protein
MLSIIASETHLPPTRLMTEYEDFVIQINPAVGGVHPIRVLRSPAGKGAQGSIPESLLADAVKEVEDASAGTDVATREVKKRARTQQRASLEETGAALFNALFSGDVEGFFRESCGIVAARKRRLRIRLQLDVRDPSIARISSLPWELMYQAPRDRFLVRSEDLTVVRELDVPVSGFEAPAIVGPVRVLFVMSNPNHDLNLTAERAEIERQLQADLSDPTESRSRRREIVAEFLEDATFAQLEDLLRRKDYHVIHFMGHGSFDSEHQGQLLFHDGMRSGRQLGALLAKERDTRLVTLNACQTAVGPTAVGPHPFAGVAAALVMAGIPAVIAMQYPVSDRAAIVFSARLYSELGRGEPIEQAVDSGRSRIEAVATAEHLRGEWATPVLFLRDASPFSDREFVSAVAAAAAAPAPPAGTTPVDGWGPRESGVSRIYVATPIRKLTSIASAIQTRLTSAPHIQVRGSPPPPDDAAAVASYRDAVRQLVDGADLCVHLLGDTPGESFDDNPLNTASIEQLNVAIQSSTPVMVLMLRQARDSIADPAYRTYIDGLRATYSSNDADRFEQATVEDRNAIPDLVLDKVEKLRSAKADASTDAEVSTDVNAYVDVLKTESDFADPLVSFLDKHPDITRVTRAKSDASRPPAEVEREFARVLRENQLYVILQGESSLPWAEFRAITASKSATTLGFKSVVAVYRAQPAEGDDRFEVRLNMLPPDAKARKALKSLKDGLK